MQAQLLLFNFYLNGRLHALSSFYEKTVWMDIKFLDGSVFKNRIWTEFRFTTHPYFTVLMFINCLKFPILCLRWSRNASTFISPQLIQCLAKTWMYLAAKHSPRLCIYSQPTLHSHLWMTAVVLGLQWVDLAVELSFCLLVFSNLHTQHSNRLTSRATTQTSPHTPRQLVMAKNDFYVFWPSIWNLSQFDPKFNRQTPTRHTPINGH